MPNIKLQSSDNVIFDVDLEVAKMSETIKEMLENVSSGTEDEVVPIMKVDSEILELVINWSVHHVNDPPYEELYSEDFSLPTDITHDFDKGFIRIPHGTLFKLMLAANYLHIRALLDLCCKCLADFIKGKSPDLIRQHFIVTTPNFANVQSEECECAEENCEHKCESKEGSDRNGQDCMDTTSELSKTSSSS